MAEPEGNLVAADPDLEEVQDADAPSLPFRVCTVPELALRGYIRDDDVVEWVWARAFEYCQFKREPGRMLMLNREALGKECRALQVDAAQIHFRGKGAVEQQNQQWKEHTLETKAFLVTLLWSLKNRALQPQCKLLALKLLLTLVTICLESADLEAPMTAMMEKQRVGLVYEELRFTLQGVCSAWMAYLAHSSGATALWNKLRARTWLNRCITSSLENATLVDIWFYCCYIYCHQREKMGGQVLWATVGSLLLPELICTTSKWIAAHALRLSKEKLQSLPLLKTKLGNVRKVCDPVNRVILLLKLQGKKVKRAYIADTHKELGGSSFSMMRHETYLDTLLHLKALEKGFWKPGQLMISWDPSNYGGREVFMGAAYNPNNNTAAYLLAQHMGHTLVSELDPALVDLARGKKLTRLDGFRELKGLACSLHALGLTLEAFDVPERLHCFPLTRKQYRLAGPNGQFYIQDLDEGTIVPQIPAGLELGKVPALISMSDQGPSNTSCLNFISFSRSALMVWAMWDPYHRAWNDLKLSLKRAKAKAWRCVLHMACVANLAFGPFQSGSFYFKKRAKREEFLATYSVNSELWASYQHLIACERRQMEPTTYEESQALFDTIHDLNSFNTKGVCVKLARWFSWWEAMAFLDGEMYFTKMILSLSQGIGDGSGADIQEPDGQKGLQSEQKQLADLKKRKGAWNLCPELINATNLACKDVVMGVGSATWKTFSDRIKHVASPEQVAQFNIQCAQSKFWAFEIVETLSTSLQDDLALKHLYPEYCGHSSSLEWHMDFLRHVAETRSMSLAVFHCTPPSMYCHALSPDPEVARQACEMAVAHWGMLLQAEDAQLGGVDAKCLATCYWRFNPLIRTLYLAYEQDAAMARVGAQDSAAAKLQLLFTKHLGDSRLVENLHQQCKDLFRGTKSDSMGMTAIMAHALRSNVLESRGLDTISFEQMEKVLGSWSGGRREPVLAHMTTKGKKLPKKLQHMMLPKHKKFGLDWPSPSPGTLFQGVASTQWLFHFFSQAGGNEKGVNASWSSFLAQPGKIIGQKSIQVFYSWSWLQLNMPVYASTWWQRLWTMQMV